MSVELPQPPQMPQAPQMPGNLKPPAGILSKLASLPGKLLGLSLAAKAALVMALFLIALLSIAWVVFLRNPNNVPWRHAMSIGGMIAQVCLLLAIPLVVYYGLRLWLEGDRSQFPDISFAWNAGLEALDRNGLSLDSTPLFLILGSSDVQQERAIMEASGQGFRVRGVPEGPGPLHWYGNPDGIYLFCSDASWISALSTLVHTKLIPGMHPESPTAGTSLAPLGQPPAERPALSPTPDPTRSAPPGGPAGRGTIALDQFGSPPAGGPSAGPAPGGAAGRGTMTFESQPPAPAAQASAPPQAHHLAAAPAVGLSTSQANSHLRTPVVLPAQDSAEQLQRLSFVCQLIRRKRQPLCPVNGMLVLLPYESIESRDDEVEEVERAIKADLMAVQRVLELRCPVTSLVTGLERSKGFRELVRRVGRDRAAVQRFGRRFDVRSLPVPEELEALTAHLCGAFEDWVYALFREEEALTRTGNTRLYGLLCQVRTNLKTRLAEVLAGGFAYNERQPDEEPIPFSGCYFAATGESEDRQAFVRGVFEKLAEEQEQVEWTRRALVNDRRFLGLAYTFFAIDGALVLSLAALIVRRLWT